MVQAMGGWQNEAEAAIGMNSDFRTVAVKTIEEFQGRIGHIEGQISAGIGGPSFGFAGGVSSNNSVDKAGK